MIQCCHSDYRRLIKRKWILSSNIRVSTECVLKSKWSPLSVKKTEILLGIRTFSIRNQKRSKKTVIDKRIGTKTENWI